MAKIISALLLATLLVGVHLKGVTIELTRQKNEVKEDKLEDGFLAMTSSSTVKEMGNFRDISYYGNIGFGKDPSTNEINWAPIVFDTGSSWLWVATSTCDCPGILSGVSIDIANTDFQSSNKEITLAYGEGGGKGELGTMTVYLSEDISYDQQYMIAMQETQGFGTGYSSGIFGLSHKVGAGNHATLLDNLYEQGTIDNKLFTVALRKETEKSQITIGEISNEFVQEGAQFTYVDLNLTTSDAFYYTLLIDEVKLGDSVTATDHYAIADTGTSFLCIPPSIADKFFQTEPFKQCELSEGSYLCPCDASFPSLEFTIGGVKYEVTDRDYLFGSGETCIVAIETETPPGDLIVLGDVFLRTVVGVFDLENESIGFAPAVRE